MKPLKILFFQRESIINKTAKVYPFSVILKSSLGAFSYVSYSCTINNAEIGKFCSIAKGVKIGLGKHPISFVSTSPLFYSPRNPLRKVLSRELKFQETQKIVIGNDVWLGANVVILDGVKIGNGAIIAANSVVTKDVGAYEIVGGVPAKLIKKRFSDTVIRVLLNLNWWDMPFSFFECEEIKSLFSSELDEKKVLKLESIIKGN